MKEIVFFAVSRIVKVVSGSLVEVKNDGKTGMFSPFNGFGNIFDPCRVLTSVFILKYIVINGQSYMIKACSCDLFDVIFGDEFFVMFLFCIRTAIKIPRD